MSPATRRQWSAEAIAEIFATEFKGREVACGVQAVDHHPVEMNGGFLARATESLS
jgi:hypothetical protein